jgi:short-subunit dehydrogenase
VPDEPQRWAGRRVWITGASSGIGETLALMMARQGAKVVLSARRVDRLQAVADVILKDTGTHAAIVPLDQAEPEQATRAARDAIAAFGGLDTVVLNGGISQRSLALETTLDVDRTLMTVNYLATVALAKAVLPSLLEQPASQLVVISSVVGRVGSRYRSGYAASKHALHGFFNSLRAELPERVTVTLICPGFVRTKVSINALTAQGAPLGTMDEAQARGMQVEVFAERALQAMLARRREVTIGGYETWAVLLHRLAPGLFARILRTARVR